MILCDWCGLSLTAGGRHASSAECAAALAREAATLKQALARRAGTQTSTDAVEETALPLPPSLRLRQAP